MTPPRRRPQRAWRLCRLPRARARARTRPSRSLPRPSHSPRASRNTTAISRPFCLQDTATRACLTTLGCLVPYPVLLPSSTATPCSFPPGARDRPRPSSTAWAWVWGTPRRAPSSSRHSSSPVATASTPSVQVRLRNHRSQSVFGIIALCVSGFVCRLNAKLCVLAGYEELTAGPAGVDYSKGYNSSSQAQAKSSVSGPGKGKEKKTTAAFANMLVFFWQVVCNFKCVNGFLPGVSVTSSNSGVPDISGSVYNKTQVSPNSPSQPPSSRCTMSVYTQFNLSLILRVQSFDKGFHAGTPPPFSLPSALGGPGPLNPGAAPGGYAPPPFLHILPHQQPHSQLLHHHLAQDGQVTPAAILLLLLLVFAQFLFGFAVSPLLTQRMSCLSRVVRASAASPAACSRRAKSTSRATAAPPTGPTEMAASRTCARASTQHHNCYLTE